MPGARMFMMVTMTLMAPRIEEAPIRWMAKISIGKDAPVCSTSGGYMVQPPAGAPPGTNSEASSSVKAKGRIQKLRLFRRGSAMSGAPTCIGIIQFASPTHAGMTAPKIMMRACMVVRELKSCGSKNCSPGLEQLEPYQHRHEAADEEHDAREDQVHRADVLVIGRVHPAPPAVRLVVVIVVRCGVCRSSAMAVLASAAGGGSSRKRCCRRARRVRRALRLPRPVRRRPVRRPASARRLWPSARRRNPPWSAHPPRSA